MYTSTGTPVEPQKETVFTLAAIELDSALGNLEKTLHILGERLQMIRVQVPTNELSNKEKVSGAKCSLVCYIDTKTDMVKRLDSACKSMINEIQI